MASGSSFVNYTPEGVYLFRYNADVSDPASVTPANLQLAVDPGRPSLCTMRPAGRRFFVSSDEVRSEIQRLEGVEVEITTEIQSIKKTLDELKPTTQQYERRFGRIRLLESDLQSVRKSRLQRMNDMDKAEKNKVFIDVLKEGQKNKAAGTISHQ